MPEISVIVPVYKAEAFLHRCVDSILAQTFTDFELILVDDGSPDGSGAICDEYAAKDARVRVIHQKNGGVSSARNAGLDTAKGNWISFVDSDDYVLPQYLEHLYEPEFDLIVIGRKVINADTQDIYFIRMEEFACTEIGPESIRRMLRESGDTWLTLSTGRLFKRSLIEMWNIRFDTGYSFREDSLFTTEYFIRCNHVKLKNTCDYQYTRRNSESLSSTYNINYFECLCNTNERISDMMLKRYGVPVHFSDEYIIKCFASCLGDIPADRSMPFKEKLDTFRYIFRSRYMKQAIADTEKYFPETSRKYRFLVKLRSPLIALAALTMATRIKRSQ